MQRNHIAALAYYTVKVNRRGELTQVTEPRLVPTQYRSRQPWLWQLSAEERLFALPVPRRRRRRRPKRVGVQGCFTLDTGALDDKVQQNQTNPRHDMANT
jgi:hypothetical protein